MFTATCSSQYCHWCIDHAKSIMDTCDKCCFANSKTCHLRWLMQQQWLALTEEGIWSRTIEALGGNLHIKIISDFGGCMWVYNKAAISGDRHVSTATLLPCMASTAVCWRKQSPAFGEWRQGLSHCSDFGTKHYTVSTNFLPAPGLDIKTDLYFTTYISSYSVFM